MVEISWELILAPCHHLVSHSVRPDVLLGFRHIHLHVISSDLVSPALKTKKHYNSFRPDAGFFLSLDDVIRMIREDKYSRVSDPACRDISPRKEDLTADTLRACRSAALQLPKSKHEYEAILKSDLECFRCGEVSPNMPALKAHLEEEWTGLRSTASASA